MRTPLEQHVLASIQEGRMLVAGDRVGVAVSGGADSVALLRLLGSLRGEIGISLLVVHFDHALRGAESDADAQFVKDLADKAGLEFVHAREDVAAAAQEHGWNLEDAARRLRYAFFDRVIAEGRATRIAVAHTADDQAETVLAHLLRGTGLTGLAGIYPVNGSVIRPLYETRREELREYLRARGELWREDSSNQDQRRLRARIRKQLVPFIERDFSPSFVDHLSRLARLAREEEVFWNALVEEFSRACVRKSEDSKTIQTEQLLAPLAVLLKSPDNSGNRPFEGTGVVSPQGALRALTERLIRRLYAELRGDRKELTAQHVENVIYLASESTSGRRLELPGGIVVERNFGELMFSRARGLKDIHEAAETSAQDNSYQYVVSLPDRGEAAVSVPELGRCFRLKVIDWPGMQSDTKRDGEALDVELLRAPLILRNWRPGDAYRPRGRRQARKLKQMFLAGRVPNRERASWPVLVSGGQVIWARGMPAADGFSAREGTRVGLVIEEDRL